MIGIMAAPMMADAQHPPPDPVIQILGLKDGVVAQRNFVLHRIAAIQACDKKHCRRSPLHLGGLPIGDWERWQLDFIWWNPMTGLPYNMP